MGQNKHNKHWASASGGRIHFSSRQQKTEKFEYVYSLLMNLFFFKKRCKIIHTFFSFSTHNLNTIRSSPDRRQILAGRLIYAVISSRDGSWREGISSSKWLTIWTSTISWLIGNCWPSRKDGPFKITAMIEGRRGRRFVFASPAGSGRVCAEPVPKLHEKKSTAKIIINLKSNDSVLTPDWASSRNGKNIPAAKFDRKYGIFKWAGKHWRKTDQVSVHQQIKEMDK